MIGFAMAESFNTVMFNINVCLEKYYFIKFYLCEKLMYSTTPLAIDVDGIKWWWNG